MQYDWSLAEVVSGEQRVAETQGTGRKKHTSRSPEIGLAES